LDVQASLEQTPPKCFMGKGKCREATKQLGKIEVLLEKRAGRGGGGEKAELLEGERVQEEGERKEGKLMSLRLQKQWKPMAKKFRQEGGKKRKRKLCLPPSTTREGWKNKRKGGRGE